MPGKGPEARVVLDKPDMATLCPASGAKLKLKVGAGRAVQPGGQPGAAVEAAGRHPAAVFCPAAPPGGQPQGSPCLCLPHWLPRLPALLPRPSRRT